jgi:membrane peptidoglycan carboxypeptidase
MGYPNRRVSMTDVHGEPQQGGYLPAEIWHAYMAGVTEGHPCAPLHEENNGIEFKPFYGKYATTGQARAASEAAEAGKPSKPKPHKAPKPAPQQAPKAPPPPAETPAIEQTGGASPK